VIINGKTVKITNSAISYESGISWKSANKRMEAIDYGINTDHVSAKISVWGTTAEIAEFRKGLPNVSGEPNIIFDKGEKPFGPAFNCDGSRKYLLIGIDDITAAGKGIAQMDFQIAALWTIDPPWAYGEIKFDIANFAVQEVKRESEEDKTISQTETGWSAYRHDWSKSKFTLSLLANSQTMGGSIRQLVQMRGSSFALACNNSMFLIDSQSAAVRCLSFGNLRRLGNSNMWQADFDFVRAA
jgi:hypothetical protein